MLVLRQLGKVISCAKQMFGRGEGASLADVRRAFAPPLTHLAWHLLIAKWYIQTQ